MSYELLRDAVSELAEILGHSAVKPISSSLFCLEHGLTIEDRDKIIMKLNLLTSEKASFGEIKLQLIEEIPELKRFSDDVFKGMVDVFLKIYVL